MAKTNSNRKKKRTKAWKGRRAKALTIAEPKLRGPREPRTNLTEQSCASLSAKMPRPVQFYEMMLAWSPWMTLLRHQALLARGFLSIMEMQQQFAQLWSLPPHRAAQINQR